MAKFNFDSRCVQEHKFRDTDTTIRIGKHVPISSSTSSKVIEQPTFSSNSTPRVLIGSFVNFLDGLATQSKVQLKKKIFWGRD